LTLQADLKRDRGSLMANSFRNFKNVLTAINFMKKKVSSRHSMQLIKEAQFDPVMDMLESKD